MDNFIDTEDLSVGLIVLTVNMLALWFWNRLSTYSALRRDLKSLHDECGMNIQIMDHNLNRANNQLLVYNAYQSYLSYMYDRLRKILSERQVKLKPEQWSMLQDLILQYQHQDRIIEISISIWDDVIKNQQAMRQENENAGKAKGSDRVIIKDRYKTEFRLPEEIFENELAKETYRKMQIDLANIIIQYSDEVGDFRRQTRLVKETVDPSFRGVLRRWTRFRGQVVTSD